MTEHAYKAFISYSHKDEVWARWLHRAIETYRVPRALRGRDAPVGKVGSRLAPVFRDRDELSMADDLGRELEQSLERSATLIVLCSPSAALSRWTSEEIQRFKALGRGDHIFCVLVDGDPEREACFPPSLFSPGESIEPLFADPRDSGDGKALARQKILAGLLGVPLDVIRQRERARRQRLLATAALAVVVSLALVYQSWSARQAEERARERAEELSMFVVDIGERLRAEIDLETMDLIAGEAMEQLALIDQTQLPAETRASVALALRQIGFVREGQGEAGLALEAYTESRDIFLELAEAHPASDDYLLELSHAEFYLGEFHRLRGEYTQAEGPMRHYEAIAGRRYEADASDPERLLELSYSTGNILALRLSAGEPVDAAMLERADEAVRLARASLEAGGDEVELLAHVAMTLAWAADAQQGACRLDDALAYRQQNLSYATQALERSPVSIQRELDVALSHSGLAMVHHYRGELDEALAHREENVRRMRALLSQDPSNFYHEQETVYREYLLAKLIADQDRLGEALTRLSQVGAWYTPRFEQGELSSQSRKEYAEYLITQTEVELRLGLETDAAALLARARGILAEEQASHSLGYNVGPLLDRVRWFEATMAAGVPVVDTGAASKGAVEPRYRDCIVSDYDARMALLDGKVAEARAEVGYLLSRGYAFPEFLRFCSESGLCGDVGRVRDP